MRGRRGKRTSMKINRERTIAVLLSLVLLAFVLRVSHLGTQGLNEDEVNKTEASQGYRHGDFTGNREHPMLLKLLIALSLRTAEAWNRHHAGDPAISEEAAVRFPNVLFGSLTVLVIFALAREFFGFVVGVVSAFVWAVLPLAIAVNRVAKEDTLLVFFSWLSYYLYLRAKKLPARSMAQQKLYGMSGAGFGLMLASKYFPHYLGLNFLFHHLLGLNGIEAIRPDGERRQRLTRGNLLLFFGSLGTAFLLLNPTIVLPGTWAYMWSYVQEHTVLHHGYLMMGRLYYNDPAHLAGRMPVYTYLLFLGIKTPISLLVAMLVGFVTVARRWRKPGNLFLIFMFLIWIVPFSFFVVKWFRYMLPLLPVVSIFCAIGIIKLARWALHCTEASLGRNCHPVLAIALSGVFVVAPLFSVLKAAPYFSLYLNPLGGNRIAYYFPQDELRDIGLREAVQQICNEAPAGSLVAGEAPVVFQHYLRRCGREDLRFVRLSELPRERPDLPRPAYLVVQDGRKYFENIEVIERVEAHPHAARTIEIAGVSAARLYRFDELAQLGLSP